MQPTTFSPHLPPEEADRLVVIMSDIEMGAGGNADDFPHSEFLGQLLLHYNEPPYQDLPIDFVFNGDTFDLLKTSYLGTYPHLISRDVALGKMSRIAAAHPRFFEALRQLLQHKSAPRRVFFILGNHDPELLFPEVQQLLILLAGGSEEVHFPGHSLDLGRIHIEHGSQLDPLFHLQEDKPFVTFNDTEVLNISWGAVALLETVMSLHTQMSLFDRLKPRGMIFELIPELKELLVGSFWQYWTRDYWKGYFRSNDPTKKLSWKMVKELIWRFYSKDPDVNIQNTFHKQLQESDRFQLYVLGHQHQSAIWSFGERKILQAGCIRNEYMLFDGGKKLRPIPKCYVEAYLKGDDVLRSGLIEFLAPPDPEGYLPESPLAISPEIQALLQEKKGNKSHKEEQHAQKEQERLEEEQAEKVHLDSIDS